MSEQNLFQKLSKIRAKIQQKNLKKTGENTFSKYKYYELGDFLPTILDLNNEYNIFSHITFEGDSATLTIYDCESEKSIVFKSPMAEASLKGAHAIQNLGAVETYQRRYLYMMAYEIVESDQIDILEKTKEEEKQKKEIDAKITEASLISNVEDLKSFWEKNKKFHKEKSFQVAVNNKKTELEQ